MSKKILKIVMLFIVFTMIFTTFCYASDEDTDVRIRVRRPRKFDEQVDLKGYGSINVYNILESEEVPIATLGENIDVLLDTFYNNKYLMQEGYDSNTIIGPYHLKLTDYEYPDYNTAKSNADSLTLSYGINFYPFYNGKAFNIYGGNFINDAVTTTHKNTLLQNGINCEVVNGLNKNISVYDASNNVVLMYSSNYNIYFTSYNNELMCNSIVIDKNTYRGMMAFSTDINKLISINKVSLDYYLYGVIANEISAVWPIEAIKAQVLAARTYAVANINPNSSVGYDMQDNQNSQVYGGYGSERSITNSCVDDTNGQMIYYDNKLITAFFHSTSGGRTENSENIWVTPLPYLKAVDDPYSNISPYTQWQKSLTKEDVLSIAKEINSSVTDVYNVLITKISENERVLECIISTNVGDITLKKENVRATLGYSVLLSSWFTITTDCDVYLISENSYIYEKSNDNILGNNSLIGDDSLLGDSTNNNSSNSSDNQLLNEDSLLDDGLIIDNEQNQENNNEKADENQQNPDNKRVSLNDKYFISSSGTSKLSSEGLSVISSSGTSRISTVPTVYYFDGRGWGHGVGMSQYGAKKMAEEGFTYEQILKHYYTGVEIKW